MYTFALATDLYKLGVIDDCVTLNGVIIASRYTNRGKLVTIKLENGKQFDWLLEDIISFSLFNYFAAILPNTIHIVETWPIDKNGVVLQFHNKDGNSLTSKEMNALVKYTEPFVENSYDREIDYDYTDGSYFDFTWVGKVLIGELVVKKMFE